jgi:biopolymer transport protein ExbB
LQNASYGLIQIFADGGFMMYPLLLASLLGLGVIIAKAYVLWAAQRDAKRLLVDVEEMARAGRLDEAVAVSEGTPGPVAAILTAGLHRIRERRSGNDVEHAMNSAGKIELGFLERGLVVLATVATVAPLLGFLGTVWGMIEAFGAIELAGQVEAALVAAGIKIALITTAAGLVIAIPVNIAYNYFVTRIDNLIGDMEEGTNAILELLWEKYPELVRADEEKAPAARGHRADASRTRKDTVTANAGTLGFDTQATVVPDADTMEAPHHRTLD